MKVTFPFFRCLVLSRQLYIFYENWKWLLSSPVPLIIDPCIIDGPSLLPHCLLLWHSRMKLTLTIVRSRRRWWHPTPVLLPGKSHGRRSLVGCSPWGQEVQFSSVQSLSCVRLFATPWIAARLLGYKYILYIYIHTASYSIIYYLILKDWKYVCNSCVSQLKCLIQFTNEVFLVFWLWIFK